LQNKKKRKDSGENIESPMMKVEPGMHSNLNIKEVLSKTLGSR
jgi:hypothetical protein